ncbi:MAG TPA: hypothetical protein VI299_12185, partial [Polyangiales bacterium]
MSSRVDGAVEASGERAGDGGVDAAAVVRDAMSPALRDAAGSQPEAAEDAAPSHSADDLLDSLPGGPPAFQFRADTVTLAGGNVETIPNRRGTDALVAATGTLAAPARDALFGGAPSLVFRGAQRLDSNLPASAWTFLHDGSGMEMVVVVYSTSAVNDQTL